MTVEAINATAQTPLVVADRLGVRYPVPRRSLLRREPDFVALEDISFTIAPGETLGVVGESGSGKSTIGRALLGRLRPSSGRVTFDGRDLSTLSSEERRLLTGKIQPVFQDPYGSLNPRMTVAQIVGEPMLVHGIAQGAEARERVDALLQRVGLPRDTGNRHPGTFSGGQRQRIGIARALAAEPRFIVADEPVSALDVSIRAQIANLFRDLQDQLGLAYLFIAHDLAVVRYVSHRIAVVYAGRIVELAPREAIYRTPRHPYTRALLDAVPSLDPQRRHRHTAVRGELGARPQKGCAFAPRCPLADARCRAETPPLTQTDGGHLAACWHA
jgi:peptide/nickel transport system ATP-binding protein